MDLNQWVRNQESGHASPPLNWPTIGYHYIITADGTIFQGRPRYTQGIHVSSHNHNTIGIAFPGEFSEPGSMPDARALASAAWLINDLMNSRSSIRYVRAHSQMPGHEHNLDFRNNQAMLDWIAGFN